MMLPKAQHYIPRFYLKNFSVAHGNAHQINVVDLKDNKKYLTSIQNVGQERGYYNIEIEGEVILSHEPALAELEGKIAPVLNKLIDYMNPNVLTPDERVLISIFCSTLMSRVPHQRETMEQMIVGLQKKIGNNATPQLLKQINLGDKQVKALSLKMIEQSIRNFSQIIYQMHWVVGRAEIGTSVHTSDNPLLRYNPYNHSPYGNLGLLCRGIQLTLPLTPYLVLFMFHKEDYPRNDDITFINHQNALHIKSLLVNQATRFLLAKNEHDFDIRDGMRTSGAPRIQIL